MPTILGRVALSVVIASIAADARAQTEAHAETREYNVALGTDCTHCHIPSDWAAPTKPAFDFARRMAAMVRGVNSGPLAGRPPITCWSCHRGRSIPERLQPAAWEAIASTNRELFANGHDDQRLAMSVYAASLGVTCTHCHVDSAWTDPTLPAHGTARQMAAMFELFPTFFDRAVRTPRTQCFMCHHGRTQVERRPQ